MKPLTMIFAGNVTYCGLTFNTKVMAVYNYTGVYYFTKRGKHIHVLSGIESAIKEKESGKCVYVSNGSYDISRLAIPWPMGNGSVDWWYITNDGDSYVLNKVSKYWKRIHNELKSEAVTKFKF